MRSITTSVGMKSGEKESICLSDLMLSIFAQTIRPNAAAVAGFRVGSLRGPLLNVFRAIGVNLTRSYRESGRGKVRNPIHPDTSSGCQIKH